jgi:spermidine/putrescine transport system permease protein
MLSFRNYITPYLLPFCALVVYMFLYVPIIILVIYSFNDSNVPYIWEGFSLRWYKELFSSVAIMQALKNSLIVASASVTLSLLMGVLFVYYGAKARLNRFLVLFYGNLAAPEIVVAVGLLSFFSLFSIPLGLTTLIVGHTLIGLGYVIPIVQTRFAELDKRYTEASLDLGATQHQTFMRIILPLLFPALFAAGLLVFILSLDDFIISFFTAGGSTQTLPLYIFSMVRSGATPVVNALSTLMLLVSSIAVIVFSLLHIKKVDILS